MKSFIFFEVCVLGVFIITLWHSTRRTPCHRAEVATAFLYALLFEELDMLFFKTYHYGEGYTLVIGNVPIVIALAWSIIIYSGMQVTDAYHLSEFIRPFADALLAVLIDLSVDAVAIRLGYWHWKIPLSEGWFGVPAGNLYAWMFVVFFFSLFCRIIRKLWMKNRKFLALISVVPFLSYAGLFTGILLIGSFNNYFNLDENTKLLTFIAIVFTFILIPLIDSRRRKELINSDIHPVIFFIRLCLHLFFIIELFYNRLYIHTPALLAVAFCALFIEIALHRKVAL